MIYEKNKKINKNIKITRKKCEFGYKKKKNKMPHKLKRLTTKNFESEIKIKFNFNKFEYLKIILKINLKWSRRIQSKQSQYVTREVKKYN